MPFEKLMLALLLCLHLLMPLAAHAQTVLKTPLSYSLQEYGIVLATAPANVVLAFREVLQ